MRNQGTDNFKILILNKQMKAGNFPIAQIEQILNDMASGIFY